MRHVVEIGDPAELRDLFATIERETNLEDPDAPEEARRGLDLSIASFDSCASDSFWILAAATGDSFVGYATVARVPKLDARLGVLLVDELYVLEAHRRQGHGQALIEAADNLVRGLGYWMLRLIVTADNADAIAFYRSLGFQQTDGGLYQRDSNRAATK